MTVTEKDIAPEIIAGPNSLSIKENDTAEFRVEITGKPTPIVKWQLNGRELSSSSDTNITIKSFEEIYILKIEKANVKHAGEVVVTAENAAGMVGKEVVLKVEPDVTKPIFKTHLIDRSVNEGEPLRWDIAIERPYKGVTVKWFLNGKELTNNENVQIIDDGEGKYHITINEAKSDMCGTLIVKATNTYGTSESHAFVDVKEVNRKPEIIRQPQDHTVEENETVKFSAIIFGKPTPTINWYMDEMKLVNSSEIGVKFDEITGKTSIKIFKANLTDSGKKITMKAKNTEGEVEASAILTVNKKSEPPNILTEMKSRQVNEGETVNFSIKVTGYPIPEVAWFHNGEPIVPSSNIKITEEDGMHTLVLNDVLPEQSGEISCEARNSVGSKKQLATLAIKPTGKAPFFERNIEDKLVVEGEELIMDAKLAEVKPFPTITWLKDGKPLQNDRFKLSREDDGTLKLKIDSVELDDKSRITIRAENQFGSADCSASIGVTKKRPIAKPAFLSDIPATTITEGESLNVKVIITGDPTPFTKWYINDQLVIATEDTEMKEENGVYSLTIHGCTKDMTGTIKCIAYNKAGEVTAQGSLTVLTPIPVEFETSLCDAVCREGDTLKLKAVLMGEPTPEVSWYVNGKKLEESQNIKIHAEKGTYTVTIRNITCDYSGKVVCEAVNEYGKAVSEASLLVLPRGEPPDFIEWLSNVKARQGSQVTHKVVFTGDPKPNLTWYINNEEMKNSDEIIIVTDENTSTLVIKNFNQEKHTGEIICKAENDAGEVSCTASMGPYTSDIFSESQTESEAMAEEVLNFEEGPEFGTEIDSIEEFQRTPTPIMAPKFITKIKDTRAARGHQAIFECVVPDTKGVCCKWLKDGREIELIARIRVQTRTIEGYVTSELIIDNVIPEDAGKYTVVVENVAGTDSCEANLNVIEVLMKPETCAPEFVVAIQDKTCNEAEKVIFECKVIGEPQPTVSWFHEKTAIVEEASKTIIESEGAIQRLVIVSADVIDRGQYICLAENVEGKAESKAILTVLEQAKAIVQDEGPPEFTELLKSCTVAENAEIILQCKLKGLPKPTISWMKDGTKLDQNHRVITEYHEDGTIILKIKNARKEDSGEYRCDAVNTFGAAWTAGPVRVATESELQREGEAPDFIEPIKPVTVSVGETAILEGKVKGEPKPEIKWFNGENIVKETSNIQLENLPDGTQRLTIKNATVDDTGEYRCVASNQYGDVWCDVTLTVQVPISEEEGANEYAAPTFLRTLEGIHAKELEHVVLECKIVGEPMPEIKWFKDKEEISANDTHFKKETLPDGTARLIIDSVNKDDTGEFRCEAQNNFGTARTDAMLNVWYDFEVPVQSEISPEFAQELKAVQATEGQQISFECRVVGVPVPEVKWFRDGEEVKSDEHVRIESLPDGTNRLVIDSVSVEDQGNYRCEATNSAGSMSSKAPLTVHEVETLKLKKGLADTKVEIGTKIRLFIEIEGKPKTVRWFHGKDEIKANKRTKLETITQNEYSLETDKAESSDEGTYRVVLSTDTEMVESSCAVTVFKHETVPVFRKGLQDQNVPKGTKLVLEIELDGTPKQIKWLKSGIPINDKIMKAKDLGNGKYQLVIDEIKENDTGEYTVQVSNDAGIIESKANITLKKEKPEIISKLKPVTVEVGEKVTFEVETKGTIKQVKWYKNGVEAKNVETKKIGDNKYQLIIDKATKDDEAEYKVVLSNEEGDAESSAKLTVKLPKIEFTKSLEDQTVDAGTKAVLSIEVNLPPKQVKWYKNGKEITGSDKAKPNKSNDNTYQLLIPDAGKDDTAEYKVVLITDDETVDSSCALTVKLPKLIIIRGLENQSVNAGEKVLLGVEVNTPPKSVKWYKNGREIGSDDKAKPIKVNDKNYQLEISNATEDDAFDYKIILSNEEDSVESSCTLTVKKPIEKPSIKKGIEDQFIAIGKSLEIAIETKGEPKVVKWYKNGQLLSGETSKTVKTDKIDDNNYVLKVEKCTLDDSGTYSVEVQNEAGQAKSSGEIIVEDKLSFLTPLEDIEVIEAEQAVFMVETNVHPRIVKWYKNGQEIKAVSGRIEMKDNTTRFQLIIKKAESDDKADYKVVLSNSAGDLESSAKLTVKKSKGQPKIIKGLEDQVIAKGDQLILEIKVDEEPTEVRWLKNGIALPKNVDAKIEKVDEQLYRLTIPQVDTTDAGAYSVEVINEVGKVQSTGNVDVDLKPEIVKGLEDCEVNEGDEQLFKVETNVPVREVKWYKNGQEIKPSPKTITKQITSKKFELIVPEASIDDTATYKVMLSNKAGTCDSSANLTVVKPNVLKVLENLKDVEVNEGEPIKLSIKVEGQPKTVKWFKNGQEIKPDDRVQITENPETGVYTLTIPESLASDDAAYRVVLSNRLGEVQSGSISRVKSKKIEPIISAATFITPLEDVVLPEGANLTLKCKVSGEPTPTLKWYKNGNEIIKNDRIVMRMALDGTATLRILDSKKDDTGRYTVTAINSAGESKSECSVQILDSDELPSEPKFVIPLKDVVAEIGTKAEFNVKVRGIPKPTLKWLIANQDVSHLDGIKIEDLNDGNWTMIIENVTEAFIGRIKCIAMNEHGKTECESQLIQTESKIGKVKSDEGYPPKFNVPLWDRRILEGQVTTIECHVDAKPIANIIWTKDGITLTESDRIEIRNTPDGACRIRINNFCDDDVGTYKCTATNTFGVADTRSNLNIQIKEKEEIVAKKEFPPRFNPPLMDKFADIDETVRLSCKVDASPKAAITWYKDGVPLRSNNRIIIENDNDGNCLLTINHSTESDDGAYRCVAINDIGSCNSACMVSIRKIKEEIKKEGEEPFFTKGLVDKWLERGDKLILQCTVIGEPKPEIRWYRNGILLRSNNKINIENTSDGLCTLTIDECAMCDEGIYRCDAENCNGKARTQSTIHIERPIEKLEKKVVEGEAPRFIIPLQDITVYTGSTIDLECKVVGDPMPAIKWSKDGMILRDDSRYQWEIDSTAGTYRLKINDANVNDEGAYRCVATNIAGSATTKSFVRIDDGSLIQKPSSNEPPRFSIALGDARAVEGQPLKLECKIEGAPLTDLIWYKDGERIIPDDRIKIESDSDGRTRLIIKSCIANDEGLYRVIATNPFGSAHSKATATVKKVLEDATNGFIDGEQFDAYRAPRVIIPLESIKIMEGNDFTLRCKFSGDPRPKIKWFKNGERVYSYGHCTLIESEDGNCELIVKNANRFDGGCYRCVAENIYGSDRTICEVAVQLKEKKPQRNFEDEIREGNAPGFSVPLAMKRAKAGDTVILECVPYGKPFPEIKWLKDGIEIESNDKIRIESLDDKTQRIILKDVDFFAEGFYRCVATNEYGTASTKGEIALEGDRTLLAKKMEPLLSEEPTESKPRIRRGLYNMSVHQGNTIEMQVCTSGWPTPTVKWFKNGQELKSSGPDGPVVVWTDERGIHHCVILNASPEDEAEYALEATNKLGTARTEGAITIIRPREVPGYEDDRDRGGMPYPPGFIRQLKNKHVFSHMPTIFDCLVVGYPPPEVEWFHNGKKIIPGGRIRIQSCGGGSHAIIIMDTLPEDAGEYVAIAKNSHGQASSSAVLDVTVPLLDSIKFDGSIDVTPYLTEEYGFKKVPHHNIPTPPDRGPFIKEVTGHYLTLSWIPTKRAPPRYPQVTYVIEIRELPEKDWILLDYNIPEPVCKVRNLELGKSYQFRVRAENIYGISDPSPASPPSRLMAPPQPVLDKNKRVIPLLDPYAEKALGQAHAEQYACAPWFAPGVEEKRFCGENDTLSITLCVSGFPDPKIIWKFRNMDIDTGPMSRIRVLNHAGTETTLIINGFNKENVGQYQCIAINQYGEAQQNIQVLLARPKFIQPLINKVVPNGKPLRLDVRIEGSPFPELKWMKDWRPIVGSSHVSFTREGSLCSLIINEPLWCDCGIYSVVAINDAGTATTSCSVTIEADGDFSMMHDIRKEKSRITLEARKVREIYEIDENDEKYEYNASN
uniref:BMA-UNC-89, isoform b n=1 Tax=Brugia malayi TaxID=6279 RepID=A0A0H5S7R9_BRUMA|nr:BMA-UNC-89, isoform b [Brugia malayi]